MSTSYSNSKDYDFQDIDVDIDSLYSKYIVPIENFRSKASVNFNNPSSAVSMTNDPQESRCHAFYRMLGLPVLSNNGLFYNPGFNPNSTSDTISLHSTVDENVNLIVRDMQIKRENDSKSRLGIYKNQNLNSMVFSLGLGSPYGQRPFNVMNGNNPFGTEVTADGADRPSAIGVDYQHNPNLNEIQKYINSFKTVDGYDLSPVSSSHMIRPILTDPATCNGVMPKIQMVCVPFLLSDKDRYLESKTQLKLCGLEFILRLRLRQRVINSESSQPITSNTLTSMFGNDGDITINDLAHVSALLLDKTDVDVTSIQDALKGVLLTEVYYLNDLYRMITGTIKSLVDSIKNLNHIMGKIIYAPMSATNGPEGGTQTLGGFICPLLPETYELENKILFLQLKINIASMQQDLGSTSNNPIDFSNFAISEFHNMKKIFDSEMQDLQDQKSTFEKEASNHLRNIEIILGEASGFGLINVLATYMALWSVSLDVLLGVLDDDAISRLYSIVELRTPEVVSRKNKTSGVTVTDAIKSIDNSIMSILASCDQIKKNLLSN
jgi:hypothetical protein